MAQPLGLDVFSDQDASGLTNRPRRSASAAGAPLDEALVGTIASAEGLNPTQQRVMTALLQQESGYGRNTSTSVNGAQGAGQIIPDTFRRYAKPGERIDNPQHNLAVMARIVKDLGGKTGDDPARIATGYFSGEGNIAREGTQAWKNDAADGNGKRVSGYVTDVVGRLGSVPEPAKPAQAAGPDLSKAPAWASIKAKPEYLSLSKEDKAAAKQAYFDYWIAPNGGDDALRQKFMATEDAAAPDMFQKTWDAASTVGEAVAGGVKSMFTKPESVMKNAGQVPTPEGVTESLAPMTPQQRRAIDNTYNALTPAQRLEMGRQPGFAGQYVTELNQRYGLIDQRASSTIDKVDPRAEKRAQRLIAEGLDPEIARNMAPTQARMGTMPGQEIPGTIGATEYDFETNEAFKNTPGLNNPLVRGVAKGGLGMMQGYAGVGEAMADLAFGFDPNTGKSSKWARGKTEAIGDGGSFLDRNLEGAISSIVQALPVQIASMGMGLPARLVANRAEVFVRSFGQEYSDGKSKGLDAGNAATRAGIFAAFEMVGESFGMGSALKLISKSAKGIADPSDLRKFLSDQILKQVPGEVLTTTGQFLTDKIPSFGLNQQAGWDEYLKQVGDTITQTVMQGGIMAGGTTGVNRGVQFLRQGDTSSDEGRLAGALDNRIDNSNWAASPEQAGLNAFARGPSSSIEMRLPGVPNAPIPQIPGLSSPQVTPDGRLEVAPPPAPPVSPMQKSADAIVEELANQAGIPRDTVLPGTADIQAEIEALEARSNPQEFPSDQEPNATQPEQVAGEAPPAQGPQDGNPPAGTEGTPAGAPALGEPFVVQPPKTEKEARERRAQQGDSNAGAPGQVATQDVRPEGDQPPGDAGVRQGAGGSTGGAVVADTGASAPSGGTDQSVRGTQSQPDGALRSMFDDLLAEEKGQLNALGPAGEAPKVQDFGSRLQAVIDGYKAEGMADMEGIVRGSPAGTNPTEQNVAFQEDHQRKLIAKKRLRVGAEAGTNAPVEPKLRTEEQLFQGEYEARAQKVVPQQVVDAVLAKANEYVKQIADQGIQIEDVDGTLPRSIVAIKNTESSLRGLFGRYAKQKLAIDKGYKLANPEAFAKTEQELADELGVPVETIRGEKAPAVKPPKPKTEKEAREQRASAGTTPNQFFTDLIRAGGISIKLMPDISGERSGKGSKGRGNVVVPKAGGTLFRKNGRNLDELATLMVELGYMTQADIDSETDNGGINKLTDMIQAAMRGEPVIKAADRTGQTESKFEQMARFHAEGEVLSYAESLGIDTAGKSMEQLSDEIDDAQDAAANTEAALASARDIEDVMTQFDIPGNEWDQENLIAYAANINPDAVEKAAARYDDDADFLRAIQEIVNEGRTRQAGQGRNGNRGSAAQEAGQQGSSEQGARSGTQEEGLLTQPTPEELRAREERQKQVEKDRASAEKDADQRAKADAERDTFELTGDGITAGQDDMFGNSPAASVVEETTTSPPARPSENYAADSWADSGGMTADDFAVAIRAASTQVPKYGAPDALDLVSNYATNLESRKNSTQEEIAEFQRDRTDLLRPVADKEDAQFERDLAAQRKGEFDSMRANLNKYADHPVRVQKIMAVYRSVGGSQARQAAALLDRAALYWKNGLFADIGEMLRADSASAAAFRRRYDINFGGMTDSQKAELDAKLLARFANKAWRHLGPNRAADVLAALGYQESGKYPAKTEREAQQKRANKVEKPATPPQKDSPNLSGRKVTFDVLVEDTGQTAQVTVDAAREDEDLTARESAMRELIDCLRK